MTLLPPSSCGTPGATRTPARGLGIRIGLYFPVFHRVFSCYPEANMPSNFPSSAAKYLSVLLIRLANGLAHASLSPIRSFCPTLSSKISNLILSYINSLQLSKLNTLQVLPSAVPSQGISLQRQMELATLNA